MHVLHTVTVDTTDGQRMKYFYDTAKEADADYRVMSMYLGRAYTFVGLPEQIVCYEPEEAD